MSNFAVENYEVSDKQDNFFEKLILVKRSSKVTKGGRVFGFSALTVVGDKNGKVGIGRGKAKEVPFAIQKAMNNAKRNLVFIKIENGTILHKICVKYCSTKLVILPASEGTGIISSYVIKSVFEAVGIRNVFAKCFGSKNPNNLVNCTIKGLLEMVKNIDANSARNSYIKTKLDI